MCSTESSNIKSVLDLGCGPGNITDALCKAFPSSSVEGIDSSSTMIESAWKTHEQSENKGRVSFRLDDIEEIAVRESKKYDVIFSNSSLHWCSNHEELLPQIVKNILNPNGGVLAIQMPDTLHQPSHQLMETAAFRSGLLDEVSNVRIPRVEKEANWYFDLLTPYVRELDMWTTDYVHQLPTAAPSYADSHDTKALRHPVLQFTCSTGLKPILEALGGEDSENAKDT
eukprot:CAMPEP_0174994822 /NCGR_PEP_ID=MMETSP0004_2-20121128/23854_1 /TAXON_ID=420556 /ORGANISM="Ochromonas sp., Strain CCMP1393" /LENGTH=226 /DNA_ID=CAMNT_0016249111 /DNA_START=155 /DNA_END=836 /DNA_ORIENTATION=-